MTTAKREKSKFRKRDLFGWLVMLPTVVLFTFFVLYLYGSFTYDSTLVKQSYTELLLHLTESGKSPAEQLFGVKLRSKADDFIRLTQKEGIICVRKNLKWNVRD